MAMWAEQTLTHDDCVTRNMTLQKDALRHTPFTLYMNFFVCKMIYNTVFTMFIEFYIVKIVYVCVLMTFSTFQCLVTH